MIYRVIISHNQTENISKFPASNSTVFVFDDPTKDDLNICTELGCTYVLIPVIGNRGNNRNSGLMRILNELTPNDYVEFFDGDRFPTTYNPDKVVDLMETHDIQCMLYSCEEDARHEKIYVPLEGATIVDTGTLCNPFYSCGFIMSYHAISRIMEFNNGFLFEPRFTKWGNEDQYLGLICEHLGLKVAITCETILNGSVGGDCDFHQDYRESLQTYVDLIREHNFDIRNESREFEVIK